MPGVRGRGLPGTGKLARSITAVVICNRNRIMTGVRFLFRVTLRRHDLAEVWHIKEPQKLPPVLSPVEVKRVLIMAISLQARAMLTLASGCGLRAGEVVRLRAGDIDSEQMIIRIVQSKVSRACPRESGGPARDAAGRGPRPVAAMVERRGRPRMTPASRRNTVGCFPVAVNLGR